jgi:hypothetical protein
VSHLSSSSGGGAATVENKQNENARHTDEDGLGAGGVAAVVLADLEAHIGSKTLALLSTELVVHQTSQGNGVTEELLGSDGVAENDHGGSDKEDVLEDTSHGQDDSRSLANLLMCQWRGYYPWDKTAYQQDNGSVKKESNQCVGNESTDTEAVDITHSKTGSLSEEGNNAVGDGAGRGVVVQRDQGVHLELGGAEQTLDHDKTEGLEDDTGNLDYMVVRTRISNISEDNILRKPTISNLISPNEAITTPTTMRDTLPRVFMLVGAIPKAQVANRVATALVA